jgi:hypothetical protein
MASLLPRSLLLRPVRHALARAPNRLLAARRGIAIVGNVPPMEPQKQRPQQQQLQQEPGEMAVGELEGASFRIEPLRRVGEDEKTMRARLVCTSSPFLFSSYHLATLELGLKLTFFGGCCQTNPVREEFSSPTSCSRPSRTSTCPR